MEHFNKNKLKAELLPIFIQLLKMFDLFELSEKDAFVFNPELFKSFEKHGFPNWSIFYPFNKTLDNTPLSFLKDIDEDIEFDLLSEGFDKVLEEGIIFKEIRKLATQEQLGGKEEDQFFLTKDQSEILLACYAWMNFSFMTALFGKLPFELYEEARQGNRDSIFKLIQVDKSFVGTDWSMREIKKAQLSGNQKFFNELAKALQKNPFASSKTNLKLCFVLVFGWGMGLGKLSNDEILDFVKELGIYGGDDSDSLYKEIHRLGLRKRDHLEK